MPLFAGHFFCLNLFSVLYIPLLQVAMRCGVPASHVRNVIIWGNHSSTQYPDVHHCVVNMSGSELACFEAVKDDAWLKGEFITVSQMKWTGMHSTVFKQAITADPDMHWAPLYFHGMLHSQTVQQRGAAVIKARKLSSAMSAAKAICDHMRDIWSGTTEVNLNTIFTVIIMWKRLLHEKQANWPQACYEMIKNV